jgi:hypothetical protein
MRKWGWCESVYIVDEDGSGRIKKRNILKKLEEGFGGFCLVCLIKVTR